MLCKRMLRGITSIEKCTANGFCMGQTDLAPVFLVIKVEYEIRKPFADSSLDFVGLHASPICPPEGRRKETEHQKHKSERKKHKKI